MKKENFNDFVTSVHQMGEIMKGKKIVGMKKSKRKLTRGMKISKLRFSPEVVIDFPANKRVGPDFPRLSGHSH